MVLDQKITKKITDFVYAKPRSIQEIALAINKNWRTVDRYVKQIEKESGHLATRTFREGSRGALKVVYFQNLQKIASNDFQERLLNSIRLGRQKEDFSPFDIYQYVDGAKRDAFLEVQDQNKKSVEQDVVSLFSSAQKQILIFSGNLSWANIKQHSTKVLDVLADATKRGVSVKIVTRVDIASITNLNKVLRINDQLGREAIEIRHAEQPLRCVVIDDQLMRLKEAKSPHRYKKGELDKDTFVFYTIYDEEWVEWMQKVFYSFYSGAVDARARLSSLKSIQKIGLIGSRL